MDPLSGEPGKKLRVAVAEKDPEDLSLISARLSSRGYDVFETSEKESLLRYLDRESVDLIMLSADMDFLGSLFLLEKIRQKSHLITVPIIMICREEELPELLMNNDRQFDDFLVKPFNASVLLLRVVLAVSRNRERVEANPLTLLPGNHAIERIVRSKIQRQDKFSVLYVDINNFKPFNDLYGFEKGDDVIRHTAKLLIMTATECVPDSERFIGHIGGDDFVVILPPAYEEVFARSFLEAFERIIVSYYNEMDQKRGCVRVTNRRGKKESFPLMSCSVAACSNEHRHYQNLGEIARDMAEVKSFLKSQPGSHYLRDRRSEPLQQLEDAAEILAAELEKPAKNGARHNGDHVEPLGKVLLNAGLISEEQLSSALRKHFETGKRLGQVLVSMNAVRSEDVGAMLEKKLKIPYVCLKRFSPSRHVLGLFTFEFIHTRRVLPLEVAGDELQLGMCDPYDIRTLDDIERITSLKPVPHLALEDEFEQFLERSEAEFAKEEKLV
jgi:diguanylate cyclase (GGDEF)-like protein